MTLIFHTPSKSCPARRFNGRPVEIIWTYPIPVHVRRLGGYVTLYLVKIEGPEYDNFHGWAYPDELHIEPVAA